MKKRYYECHITMLGLKDYIELVVTSLKWKFSAIDGDPELGAGIKCYATMHFNERKTEQWVITELNRIADMISGTYGVTVIRRKVELVLYDYKE